MLFGLGWGCLFGSGSANRKYYGPRVGQRKGEEAFKIRLNQAFADSLTLVRSHDERKLKKEIYANSPHIERKISSPNTDDMQTLVEGGKLALEKISQRPLAKMSVT